MRTLINSLHPDDYQDMEIERRELQDCFEIFKAQGNLWVVIPHEHRYWEYATALMMLKNLKTPYVQMKDIKYLDVGSGWSLIGPALSYLYNVNVTECEPSPREFHDRIAMNAFLSSRGKKELRVLNTTTDNLPDERFDMVSCISVIEHMPADIEQRCWKNLVDRIKPGGLFFIDVDCVPDQSKHYTFDEMRSHNFSIPEMKERVEHLKTLGMEVIGEEPDYNWNGAQVHDFTFFRIGMRKAS